MLAFSKTEGHVMKQKNKHCHSLLLQPKKRNNIKIHCEGLENRPVSHAELKVIETYANDLIRTFAFFNN